MWWFFRVFSLFVGVFLIILIVNLDEILAIQKSAKVLSLPSMEPGCDPLCLLSSFIESVQHSSCRSVYEIGGWA